MIIRSEEIYQKATSIVRSCGTRNTLKIARELGIYVDFIDDFDNLLGMYTYRHKERHILLNSKMEEMTMQMVCGHEIGHDIFHRDLAKGNNALPEFVIGKYICFLSIVMYLLTFILYSSFYQIPNLIILLYIILDKLSIVCYNKYTIYIY